MFSSLSIIVIKTLTNEFLIKDGWCVGQHVNQHDSPYVGISLHVSEEIEAFATPREAQRIINKCSSHFVGCTFKVVTYYMKEDT